MTWFKVDDGFWSHPKVVELGDSPHYHEAIALWALAGAWSAQHLTDGLVPVAQVRRLLCSAEAAEALVTHGLWEVEQGGYRFHDWTALQPSKLTVLARREKEREKKAKARAARDTQRASLKLSPGDTEGDSPGVSALPVPSRPDLSLSKPLSSAWVQEFGEHWRMAWERAGETAPRFGTAATEHAIARTRDYMQQFDCDLPTAMPELVRALQRARESAGARSTYRQLVADAVLQAPQRNDAESLLAGLSDEEREHYANASR